jgi:hypothetical protein
MTSGGELKIEKGIPAPATIPGSKYDQFEIGDSAFVAGVTTQQVTNRVSHYAKRHNKKFSCRAVVENGVKGTRFWRVA